MGVSGALRAVLPAAGRKVDLRLFANGIQRTAKTGDLTPLRIGVDICIWIASAESAFCAELGDSRHLSNYGRAALTNKLESIDNDETLSMERDLVYVNNCTEYVMKRLIALRNATNSEILVVFDGSTPPCKGEEVNDRRNRKAAFEKLRDEPVEIGGSREALEQRIKAFRNAGAGKHRAGIYTAIMDALRDEEIPFLVAPFESDGQLAYLSIEGYIDLIVTEDSDLLAYGASPIMFKLNQPKLNEGIPEGVLVCKEDLAANEGRVNLLDFSPAMLSVLFVAAGTDYSTNLKGIGIVTACEIVRKAFLSGYPDPLTKVFEGLFERVSKRNSLTDEFKENYKETFLASLLMYRHPVIFDPIERRCYSYGIYDHGHVRETEAVLLTHTPYRELVKDSVRREKITGKIYEPSLATLIAEGYVCARTKKIRKAPVIPACVRNELVQLGLLDDSVGNMDSREKTNSDIAMDVSSNLSNANSLNGNSGVKRNVVGDLIGSVNCEGSYDGDYDTQPLDTQPNLH